MVTNLLRPAEPVAGPRELSPRQREVLQLLAEGRTMKEIVPIHVVSRPTSPAA
jgi:DNA-binding CsgD family transcriptional regulator